MNMVFYEKDTEKKKRARIELADILNKSESRESFFPAYYNWNKKYGSNETFKLSKRFWRKLV